MVLDEASPGVSPQAHHVPVEDEDEDDQVAVDSPENVERFNAVLSEAKVNTGTIFTVCTRDRILWIDLV